MRKIGYARVSTDDQGTAAQVAALKQKALDSLGRGDTFVVWKLDRLSRSLSDMLHLLTQIKDAGASFESLTEHIETKSAAGELMMNMLGCFAQFERQMIKERTKLGIARARAEGKWGNRQVCLVPCATEGSCQNG